MNKPESYHLKKIMQRLSVYKLMGDVIWYARTQAGRIGKITLGKAGQPDITAIVNQQNGSIAVLFLEVKKDGVDRLRYEQQVFFNEMSGKPKVLCEIINDHKKLPNIINRVKNI